MKLMFILFLAPMLFLLLFFHWFIYISLTLFFAINSSSAKQMLLAFLTVLAASFIASSTLVHYWENWFSRWFYFFAVSWLGLLSSLIIFFTVSWLIVLVVEKVGFNSIRQIIGFSALAVSFVFTGYGIWNGLNPIVKEFKVKIKNIPLEWQGKTVVQLSDVHLGPINGEAFIKKIVAKVNEVGPAAVFITGDYFDGMDGRLQNLANPLDELNAPLGVYYITGNHETYIGLPAVFEALKKTKVTILNDQSIDLSGLTVVGVEYPRDFNQKKNIPELLGRLKVSRPSILLYHEPRQIEEVAASGLIDLMLAGHSHNGQVWPVKYISRLVYGIYVTGLHQIGDFTEYTSVGTGTWGPPLRTGNRPEIVVITLE